jgi:hypothetical protein
MRNFHPPKQSHSSSQRSHWDIIDDLDLLCLCDEKTKASLTSPFLSEPGLFMYLNKIKQVV